ncbi:MAG: 4Fe-4S binding protein [gamma proteobacterium symbiont of Bathyaustriella thionipta]|nr:4Fe-4S binding protein [gamma proteobacterium symbiont of Bathyaustriella thionipta]MCU7950761.1 4Fe-4S binding protein [gamma proteobacterium symbiont of Bathyaustriella thionipta]MCU7952759.1 4Fe-4S binding protein [gamma proteobacterium symbiont of Bathyaustriella thionipta]MCU7957259.1 4Fe-4S binding protein [gamma proteobacterium symbiont of Bathyaustriella thionipta]MCU7968510.1 4Fe-4S binding protein [gamma proteobacterium symbiont of Bathyaustriella thionipta]
MNLTIIRRLVQLIAFIVMVYGIGLGGYYLADKFSSSLPALACAYDMETADHCALISFQHQMDHRTAPVLAAGGSIIEALMPTLITLATFGLLMVVLSKAFCGWICPLGFFQELLNLLGQKLGFQQTETLGESFTAKTRPVKWLMMIFLLFVFPLLAGFGVVGHELGDPFCRICPSRILTTLATGDTKELVVDTSTIGYLMLSVLATFLFGLMMSVGMMVRQPFCRICPMLAVNTLFKKIGLVRLVKDAKPRCVKCGLCAKACPMDIHEIHTDMENKDVIYPDCTLCGRCVEFCPDKDVLKMKYAFFPILSADPAYFKKRKKAQTQWEKVTLFSKKK